MRKNVLYSPSAPWVYLHATTEDEEKWLPSYLYKEDGCTSVIRILRGNKMANRQELMDEFGAALQLYGEFGENWYALKERLLYLDEVLPANAYVIVVSDCLKILSGDSPDELKWFLQTIDEVGEWWSQPITDNGRFNRNAAPFHLVLRCREQDVDQAKIRFPGVPLL